MYLLINDIILICLHSMLKQSFNIKEFIIWNEIDFTAWLCGDICMHKTMSVYEDLEISRHFPLISWNII